MSCVYGENRDVFFPKLNENLHLITFAEIAVKFLHNLGYEPYLCKDEEEARILMDTLPDEGKWPCLFAMSDTTGEKDFEEFYTNDEVLDLARFNNLGIIKNNLNIQSEKLNHFTEQILKMRTDGLWNKNQIVELFHEMIPNFGHKETGKYLDAKM